VKTYEASNLKLLSDDALTAIVDKERVEWEKVYFNKKSIDMMLEIMFPRASSTPSERDLQLKLRVNAVGELWKRNIIAW